MREVINRVVPLVMVGLLVFQFSTKGLPAWDWTVPIVGPSNGPRAVVTIIEDDSPPPEVGALRAQLRNDTSFGKSEYRAYFIGQDAANGVRALPDAYQGEFGLYIGTLTSDGKMDELLYSGELPKTKEEVLAKWREVGGE